MRLPHKPRVATAEELTSGQAQLQDSELTWNERQTPPEEGETQTDDETYEGDN